MKERRSPEGVVAAEDSAVAVIAALAANIAIAVSKLAAFAFTGAVSMLAEGIHSVADSANQALLLVGRARSKRAPTSDHPFGYGQEAYFWAFLVAIVLFTMGALFSLLEGYEKLRSPHEVESPIWALGVLLLAVVFEGASLATAVRKAGPDRDGSWWRYIRDTRSPTTAVVLLEDSAAELGLLAALAGLSLTIVTGDARFDALGSIAIGSLLAVVASVLAREMRSLLIGESADLGAVTAIRGVLDDADEVDDVVDLRTMHLGPNEVLVAARVRMAPGLEGDEVAERIADLATSMRHVVPNARQVYIEPSAPGS